MVHQRASTSCPSLPPPLSLSEDLRFRPYLNEGIPYPPSRSLGHIYFCSKTLGKYMPSPPSPPKNQGVGF